MEIFFPYNVNVSLQSTQVANEWLFCAHSKLTEVFTVMGNVFLNGTTFCINLYRL